jgi:hypothetical protein
MTTRQGTDRPQILMTPDPETVEELTVSVQKHLGSLAAGRDVPGMVRKAVDELAPVTVLTYLPVLVERRIRSQIR